MRFNVKHLLVLTGFAAVNFAIVQFPATFVQAAIVIQVSIAVHFFIARRLQCYESILAGVVATSVFAVLIPDASGGSAFGRDWLGMLDPLSMVRWVCMLSAGGYVQARYAHVCLRQELLFEREWQRSSMRHNEMEPRDRERGTNTGC